MAPATVDCIGTDRDYIVYHACAAEKKAEPTPRISDLLWDQHGWPTIKVS